MEPHNKISNLIIKYLKTNLSDGEQEELNRWRRLSEENESLFKVLTDETYLVQFNNIDLNAERKKIKQLYTADTGKSLPMRRARYRAMAAGIIVIITAGIIWLLFPLFINKPVLVTTESKKLPGSIPAIMNGTQHIKELTLTFSNGSTLLLDTMTAGARIIYQNSQLVKINKEKLQIIPGGAFTISSIATAGTLDTLLNIIRIPRGRRYELELADGSTVLLNAASTFSFPMTFGSHEREVELTGEAFFKIKPVLSEGSTRVPFIVNARGMMINVLGTQFNVSAYEGEPVATTLLSGIINLWHAGSIIPVKPGQQATLNHGKITIRNDINVETVTAWKNNKFDFETTPLADIMQQLKRWYDIDEVIFHGCESMTFTTTRSRDETLEAFLKKIEGTGEVHFIIEGRKIIVTSK